MYFLLPDEDVFRHSGDDTEPDADNGLQDEQAASQDENDDKFSPLPKWPRRKKRNTSVRAKTPVPEPRVETEADDSSQFYDSFNLSLSDMQVQLLPHSSFTLQTWRASARAGMVKSKMTPFKSSLRDRHYLKWGTPAAAAVAQAADAAAKAERLEQQRFMEAREASVRQCGSATSVYPTSSSPPPLFFSSLFVDQRGG